MCAQAEYQRILTTNVQKLTYEEIKSIDVSAPIRGWHQPEYIITFAEALEHVKTAPDKFCFAELKKCATSEERVLTAELAAKVIKKSDVTPKQVIIISFGLDILIHMKKLLPSFECLHLMYPFRAMDKVKTALDAGMDGVDLLALPNFVTQELIDYVHSRDKRVVVWIWKNTKLKSIFFPPTDTLKNLKVFGHRGIDDFTTDLPPDILAGTDIDKNVK